MKKFSMLLGNNVELVASRKQTITDCAKGLKLFPKKLKR